MGFLTSLFGGENTYLTAAIALGIVIVLIVLGVWLVKLLGDASRSVGRNRNRRLVVTEMIALDQRRRAMLIRRDGVEHLIVTGGPNDLVVESGIEPPAQPAMQRPQQRARGARNAPAAPPTEPEENADKPVAKLRTVGGRTASRSLRHTGLLRNSGDEEPQLGGGKPDNPARMASDSGKTRIEPTVSDDDRLYSEPEPAHGEHAEDGAKSR